MYAIETSELSKIYRTGFFMRAVPGLKNLSIQVEEGEIFGFIGPNGAGKTTTIKILAGLHKATAGKATIFGKSHKNPESRRSVGFLPERPYFYEHLTAREVLKFYAQLFEIAPAQRDARIEELLERVNLRRWGDVPLRKYSKGMLQRVGLCQALIHDPNLLILDEPMSGLDPVGRALVRDVILEERLAGKTVFFSSHILPDVQSLSDRVAIVIQGELRGVGRVDELLSHGTKYADVLFRGIDDPKFETGEIVRTEAQGKAVRVPPDQVRAVSEAIWSQGGEVVQILPERATLEDVFLDELDKAVDPKRMGVLA